MTDNLQKPMKWWGWGADGEAPDFDNKPHLWGYITAHLGLDGKPPKSSPPPSSAKLPPAQTCPPFAEAMQKCGLQLYADDRQRLLHFGGKSFRDLWHARRGIIPAAPDAVVYLQNDADAASLIRAAQSFDVVVIPFGGGSNIAGCLMPYDGKRRMIVAADTTMMNQLLSINEQAQTARMQAGALGGVLEQQLGEKGWTFGHFPDSFLHSTLGGWIATRSAGMQSDEYGNIENLIAGLKVQTPAGEWIIKPHPRSAAAVNQKEVVLGSEGTFGIITEAVIKIRRAPQCKLFYGYLFADFAAGLAAVQECMQRGINPLLSRLSDYNRTALSFSFRDGHGGGIMQKAAKCYMQKVRGVNFGKCCLMITAFEGSAQECRQKFRAANAIFGKYGGVFAGRGPGDNFARAKFDFPHIRDYLWDYGLYADVSETATQWDNAENLRTKALASLESVFAVRGLRGWCGCHLSHSYRNGASLYFSFAFKGEGGDDDLLHYFAAKKAVQDAFAENGGTLSHHHAVGTDHAPWLEDELSPLGIAVIGGIKSQTDPRGIMNPGKLRPLSFDNWRADIPADK
ncbi:MAG: FAD-binding oxidoreductase [Gammaproteobacteria bacterium]